VAYVQGRTVGRGRHGRQPASADRLRAGIGGWDGCAGVAYEGQTGGRVQARLGRLGRRTGGQADGPNRFVLINLRLITACCDVIESPPINADGQSRDSQRHFFRLFLWVFSTFIRLFFPLQSLSLSVSLALFVVRRSVNSVTSLHDYVMRLAKQTTVAAAALAAGNVCAWTFS